MTDGHAPCALIADYAAGALSPGLSLVVASHLTYCSACRDKATRLEALGGALLAAGRPDELAPACLAAALAAIGAPDAAAPAEPVPVEPRDPPLPRPLCCRLPPSCALEFEAAAPGVSVHHVEGFAGEGVALFRAEPGAAFPAQPARAAMVVTGLLHARSRDWERGALLFDRGAAEVWTAGGREPCLCLAAGLPTAATDG